LAVLTFGGLVARLVGPRWAPLGALVLAISMPEQFPSRSTYSEPVVQILFLGGLCFVIDSFDADKIGTRVTAALGGLALGLTLLVRIDGASDMLPVIPYCGLLLLGRRRQAVPLLAGLVVGAVYGGVDGLVLSRPYLTSIKSSLEPFVLVAVAVVMLTVVAVLALWQRGLPEVRGRWLPNAVAVLAFVVTIGFAIRPHFQTVHGQMTKTTQDVIASFQRADHLAVDPTRLYYEISLHWVFWYIGVPAVVLGTLGAAVLSRRCLWGRAPMWTLALMTFAWTIVTALYQPAITPDQPWASRRLVPAVLPGFILLAVWASSWLVGQLRQRGFDRVTCGGLGAVCAAALVLPARHQAHHGQRGVHDHVFRRDHRDQRHVRGDSPQRICRHRRWPDRRPSRRGSPGDVRRSGSAPQPRPVAGRAAGGARHPAGGPAAGAPCCRAITAHPVRRPDEAGHGAAQQAGRAHLDDSAEGNLETHLQRLDVGAVSVTVPLGGAPAATPETVVVSAPVSTPSPPSPYVSIILPCYNEQDHVTLEVARICAAMDASGYEYELLAFNDASTDDT